MDLNYNLAHDLDRETPLAKRAYAAIEFVYPGLLGVGTVVGEDSFGNIRVRTKSRPLAIAATQCILPSVFPGACISMMTPTETWHKTYAVVVDPTPDA